jgi:hypothetical protein
MVAPGVQNPRLMAFKPSEEGGVLLVNFELNLGAIAMGIFDDSLRGYSFKIHERDNFICRFCGVDGTKSFDIWLTLSSDHLLPKGHPERDNPDYIVTACNFCNTADNRYFEKAEDYGLKFDGMTPEELVAQRLHYVHKVRDSYRSFWVQNVLPHAP